MAGQTGRPRVGIVSDVVLQRHRLQAATSKFGLEVRFPGIPSVCWATRSSRMPASGWLPSKTRQITRYCSITCLKIPTHRYCSDWMKHPSREVPSIFAGNDVYWANLSSNWDIWKSWTRSHSDRTGAGNAGTSTIAGTSSLDNACRTRFGGRGSLDSGRFTGRAGGG